MTRVTVLGVGACHASLVDILPESMVDAFIQRRGTERATVLAPLRPRLIARPEPPRELELMVEPARWLLEQAGRGGLWLDHTNGLRRGFAARASSELGFPSPPLIDDQETFLEIDAVHLILAGSHAFVGVGRRQVLGPQGRAYLEDHVALWYTLAGGMGMMRPWGFLGEVFEIALAWLLRDELGYEHLSPVIEEAASACHIDTQESDFEEILRVGIYSSYTFLRAMSAFVPRDPDVSTKPRLCSSGKAAAVEALRAAAAPPKGSAPRAGRAGFDHP